MLSKLSNGQVDEWAASGPDTAASFDWTPTDVPFDDLKAVWSLHYAHGVLYAGTNPAELISSSDGGATWKRNGALKEHPSRDSWNPGAAGLVLHTIDTHRHIRDCANRGICNNIFGRNSMDQYDNLYEDDGDHPTILRTRSDAAVT